MMKKEIRYKVMIRAYVAGPWSSIVERPVTSVSWETKSSKPYWLSRLSYARTSEEKPLLFSKAAAEAVAAQVSRWKFAGPGPNQLATVRIVEAL